MTLTQVWGVLLILILCPLVGGLPLIKGITYGLTRQNLSNLGTGNISVSAAFYHGGTLVGVLAVLSEALKGIFAVLLARAFFPSGSVWELVALIALVMGRYWMGKGAGTTNVVWGIVVHDWRAAVLTLLIGGVSFTVFRDRRTGRLICLFLFAFILILLHPKEPEYMGMAIALAGLIAWIYQKIPDDLELPEMDVTPESKNVFRFFRGDKAIVSLNRSLDPQKVGAKAANLSYLKRLGYAVPDGWVLPPGDDPQPLLDYLNPSPDYPLVVRSSAIGEDDQYSSSAGQYLSILDITTTEQLSKAIIDCITAYNRANAQKYRQDRHQQDASMAILIQKQIRGVFSGVAFSRDPVNPLNPKVVIETLPGDATRVVSGKITPERYDIDVDNPQEPVVTRFREAGGDIPPSLIEKVAHLARELETHYRGIPQDIEWSYDGEQLWILQSRPITNLQPIWTRKIAAEVIPGVIRPLTWSINRPLTCGVWGKIFTLVLGKRARGLDFEETATLHYQRAYFNATLLGKIFLRMGLPPESLEFLTRGAKFSQPPLLATLQNLPGLLRLLQREWKLENDFEQDNQAHFQPLLEELSNNSPKKLTEVQLWQRIEQILSVLEKATYYSILAPLSLALRQGILKIPLEQLDNTSMPEVASMRELAETAIAVRHLLPMDQLNTNGSASLFAYLAENPDGKSILEKFEQWLDTYGYLGEVGTDIAVPRWRDNPRPARILFTQFLFNPSIARKSLIDSPSAAQGWKLMQVQRRLNLKGQVTEIYSRLLAQLRWSFLALEKLWHKSGILEPESSIFFLELAEIRHLIEQPDAESIENAQQRCQQRKQEYERNLALKEVPLVLYNQSVSLPSVSPSPSLKGQLKGIPASAGQVEGQIKILNSLQAITEIDAHTIVVVPYTDSGWTPLLAQAGGIISEVGGILSHGAIIAREYGIPAIMEVENARERLQDGQRVRLDGQTGIVEILDELTG